jgi:GNAT superfamily N-acetyltransferase
VAHIPISNAFRRWTEGDAVVTTDPASFDQRVAVDFLASDSYWARDRTEVAEATAVEHSRCYALLQGQSAAMVGGARAVTDFATFAWIADVFVLPAARGSGLGKFLMRCITDDLVHVDRLFLGTRDAHGLYAQFGFVTTDHNERWMERLRVTPRQ